MWYNKDIKDKEINIKILYTERVLNMKLKVNPENGWVHILRDSDMERTIFFFRKGAKLLFTCRVTDEKELIKIPMFYNAKEGIMEVDGVPLEEDTEISIKKDDFVETFAFLPEEQIENYDRHCKIFTRRGDY